MNCPVCKNAALVMSERQGVEIDYCPTCRGVWLDRGELDKIIERSMQEAPGPLSPPAQAPSAVPWSQSPHGYEKDHHKDGYRKKSIWKELFD